MLDHATTQRELEARLEPIFTLLERRNLVAEIAERESRHRRELVGDLARRQVLGEIANKVNGLAPAEVAHLLEMLPPDKRRMVWQELKPTRAGGVLWEVSGAVAGGLVHFTDRERLLAICREIDVDSLGQIAGHLP